MQMFVITRAFPCQTHFPPSCEIIRLLHLLSDCIRKINGRRLVFFFFSFSLRWVAVLRLPFYSSFVLGHSRSLVQSSSAAFLNGDRDISIVSNPVAHFQSFHSQDKNRAEIHESVNFIKIGAIKMSMSVSQRKHITHCMDLSSDLSSNYTYSLFLRFA